MLANLGYDEESGAILGSSSLRQQPTLLCPLDAHLLPLHIELDQPCSQIFLARYITCASGPGCALQSNLTQFQL